MSGADRIGEWLARLLRPADQVTSLSERLERIVLGGARRYTRVEVEERSGVARERNERLWRALGFADVDDEDVVFTDADVEALKLIDGFVDSGLIDPTVEAAVARAAGQSLSRLAEWEIGLLNDYVVSRAERGPEQADEATVLRFAETILPMMEQLHSYVWRRHIAALVGRALAASPDELVSNTLVVGFADVVGYTRLTRTLTETELARLLERFESTAAEVVANERWASGQDARRRGDVRRRRPGRRSHHRPWTARRHRGRRRTARPARRHGPRQRPQPLRRCVRAGRQHRQPTHVGGQAGDRSRRR